MDSFQLLARVSRGNWESFASQGIADVAWYHQSIALHHYYHIIALLHTKFNTIFCCISLTKGSPINVAAKKMAFQEYQLKMIYDSQCADFAVSLQVRELVNLTKLAQ